MINIEILKDFSKNKNCMMLLVSVLFMSGILAYFTETALFYSITISIILSVLLYFKIYKPKIVLLFILVFYFGYFLTQIKTKDYDGLTPYVGKNVQIQGVINSIPRTNSNKKVKFFLDVEKIDNVEVNAKTYTTISNNKKSKEYNIGNELVINGKLRKPFTATNPSQFDYSNYLRNFNTFTTLYTTEDKVQILGSKQALKWKFLQKLNNTRNRILKTHSKYLKSGNLEILGGIVFGDDAISTPEDIKNSFVNSGLLHILAASGMNVAYIFTFWFFILKLLKIPYKARIISGIGVILLYTLMTGLGASVIRASLMLIFVLIGKLIDRDTHSVSLLAFVATIMLIYNPAYINDVSFQLSFLVTFGLLTTANYISQNISKIPNWIKAPVIIPLVAQIWVAPIQMFYFNTFCLYSVLANITSATIVSVISFCGFLSSVISIIPPLSDITCKIIDFFLNYLITLLITISNFFGGLKYNLLQTSHPSITQLVIYYSMLLVATIFIKLKSYKKLVITLFSFAIILSLLGIKTPSNNLEIIAFDVQNADSFLIKSPKNKYFMIDTGKTAYESGNSQSKIIMLKYLKDNGIKKLDGLIITHFDNDHSGGATDILSNMEVKTIYLNSTNTKTKTAKDIHNTINKTNQRYEIIRSSKEIYLEDNFSIKTYVSNLPNENENSIITKVTYKNFDMLFMGDAGVEAFNKIEKNLPHDIEVLKVGHHGGPNVVDDKMLAHLGNKISLISTGLNYFGHPTRGTLDTLRNTTILRTDLSKSIKIKTNGKIYEIFFYNSHDKKYKFREKFISK